MQCILVSSWARVLSFKTQVLDIYTYVYLSCPGMGEEIGHRGMDNFLTCITAILLSFFKITDDRIRFFTKKLKWNSFSYQIKEQCIPWSTFQKNFKNSFKVSCNLLISTLKSIPVVHSSTKCAFLYTII